MLPIGRWVLRKAVRCAREWQRGALAGAVVGVNLTSLQFEDGGFVEHVAAVLREEELPGRLLELELTERMVTADLVSAGATLARLKALGVRISLDDFGTGYTSLAQLKALPVDRMKIDRCFIADLPHDRKSAAITRAIVQLAQGLGIGVIAEGVENDAQRRVLVDYGCDELQGHAISEPLAFEALKAWAGARATTSRQAPPAA
jgi:EAL domain-containing protein (putative c-di-GMP-specific phosphodiesterase class I)